MARITVHASGLVDWRFAISPLHATVGLLYFRARAPHAIPRQWFAAVSDAVSDRRLRVLALLTREGALGYLPDFLTPEPTAFEADPDDELHRVAAARADRVAYEMSHAIDGPSWATGIPARRMSRRPAWLLDAVDRGERQLAEDLAGQLAHAWHTLVAPSWPTIRTQLEDDIAYRTRQLSQHGLARMLAGLSPAVSLAPGGLAMNLATSFYDGLDSGADTGSGTGSDVGTGSTVVLTPTAFGHRPVVTLDPPGAPGRRAALIGYPSVTNVRAEPTRLDELIGVTRAELLSELRTPQSTDQLAQRLHLSPSTVSYHLQILLRSGLAFRVRDARRVYYHAVTHNHDSLAAHPASSASSSSSGSLGRLG